MHVDLVPPSAPEYAALATPPEFAEACLFVCPPARLVERDDLDHDAAKTERGEGIVEGQPDRFRAVALPPVAGLADNGCEVHCAVALVYGGEVCSSYTVKCTAFSPAT